VPNTANNVIVPRFLKKLTFSNEYPASKIIGGSKIKKNILGLKATKYDSLSSMNVMITPNMNPTNIATHDGGNQNNRILTANLARNTHRKIKDTNNTELMPTNS